MPENKVTEQFTEWVRQQLQDHAEDIADEMKLIEPKKSITITAKLTLKHVAGNVFRPIYKFAVPRAAVKEADEPDQQMQLPGV